jgi:CCR4-NOT transcriptional regulation complex NOT5 subunit
MEPEAHREYIKEFVQQISSLPSKEKMAQIGIEPSVLGMPRDNITFAKARSYFMDVPFDAAETTRIPKQWLEFAALPSPVQIIRSVPELTLFFMFYAQPADIIQSEAYAELQSRGWTYSDTESKWSCRRDGDVFEFDLHSWSVKRKTV